MRFIKRVLIGWLAVTAASVAAAATVKKTVPAFGDPEDDTFSLVAALGGQEFLSTANSLNRGSAVAVMGGIEIDLTGAVVDERADIRLRAVMGGISLRVPESWRVEVVSRAFMGEVENYTNPDALPEQAPLLLVHANAVLGGIEITTPEVA